ncbi:unnamed protein product, partial [Amoebophrya sp. A120]
DFSDSEQRQRYKNRFWFLENLTQGLFRTDAAHTGNILVQEDDVLMKWVSVKLNRNPPAPAHQFGTTTAPPGTSNDGWVQAKGTFAVKSTLLHTLPEEKSKRERRLTSEAVRGREDVY